MEFRVRLLMDKKNITQEQMAELLKCSVGQVNHILSFKRGKWVQKWVPKLAEALQVQEWEIFANPETVYPDRDKAIVSAYHALPPGERQAVDKVLFSGTVFPEQDYPLASNAMHDSAGSQHRSSMTPEQLEYIQKQLRGEI